MGSDYLNLDPAKCTGCRSCESICSITNEKILNRAASRIRVFRSDVLELTALFCNQCEDRPCLTVCPEGAFQEVEGKVEIDGEKCTGCRLCSEICGRIFFLPESDRAVICTLCGACTVNCPEKALEIRSR